MIRRALARRRSASLDPHKLRAIDVAFEELGCRSFADLGGVWAVDGGYSLYATEVHRAVRGVLVDDDLSGAVRAAAARLPALSLIEGDFGAEATAAQVGEVDAVLLFDVLLHQVDPDWDAVLARYAPRTRAFVIVQPQWDGASTVRLLDLGEAEYLAAIPSEDPIYDGLFDRLDEINPRRGKPWRDVHDIWQWGIADDDLVARLDGLGFACRLREDAGPWRGLERFHTGVFVFERG